MIDGCVTYGGHEGTHDEAIGQCGELVEVVSNGRRARLARDEQNHRHGLRVGLRVGREQL